MRRTTALVAGAGPAGLAAAIGLARGGAKPLVVERHRETPDLLCGGFVSWQTLETIEALGIEPAALGGHAIDQVGLYAGDQSRVAKLPNKGMGLSRRRLDGLLREAAAAAGAKIEVGTGLSAANSDGEARLADGSEITAEALFLATGKYELRGLKRPVGEPSPDPWMGIRYRLPASARLQDTLHGAIEMHIVRHGYAGLLLQEDGSANLCMAVRRSRLREAEGDTRALLRLLSRETPSLADRLDGKPVRTVTLSLKKPLSEMPIDEAFAAIADCAANGELTMQEAAQLACLMESRVKALELKDLEQRIDDLEKRK